MKPYTGSCKQAGNGFGSFLFVLAFSVLLLSLNANAQTPPLSERGGGRLIVPERLPDLSIPRSGHSVFFANGELVVAGGHTTGFVPVQTAEYLSDGEWHSVPITYPHDNGFSVVLQSGQVLMGGGHKEELGVGQTYTLECYDPQTHGFEGFGCLYQRRVMANASPLADGRVIISGNHYGKDAICYYDGSSQVQLLKEVRQGRCNPYILPVGSDDALILGPRDSRDETFDTLWVDRLKGDAFRVPLLEEWKLLPIDQPFSSGLCATGDGSYLLTVINRDRQLGVVMVRDTVFSLLPTTEPIPMKCEFGPIGYWGPVVVDQQRQRGYMLGADSLFQRQYILAIDYSQWPAPITLYYTEPQEHVTITIPVVTPDGDLILAGGIPNDNYKPLSAAWRYHFGTEPAAAATPLWPWLLLVAGILLAVLAYIIYIKLRRKPSVSPGLSDSELMERICQFIEEDQRYLVPRLKLSTVALELGVSVSDVTDCISRERGLTFAQLVAEYRVHHAQRLLTEQPDMKLAAVIAQSGFTSESTFFRTFKEVTGISPRDWVAQENGEM